MAEIKTEQIEEIKKITDLDTVCYEITERYDHKREKVITEIRSDDTSGNELILQYEMSTYHWLVHVERIVEIIEGSAKKISFPKNKRKKTKKKV